MKNYFESIVEKRVTRVTLGNKPLKGNKHHASAGLEEVEKANVIKGNLGNYENRLPLVTSDPANEVTTKAKEFATLPALPKVTCEFEGLCCIYEEKAEILEYEYGLNREEAEREAYKEALVEYFVQSNPEILAELTDILMKGDEND